MKKIISLALVCVMMLGILSMVSFADAQKIEVEPYSNGWENWSGQTQLLIIAPITPNDTTKGYTWKITIDGTTFTLVPSSNYDFGNGNAIWRFETCLGKNTNMYVPTAGAEHTVAAEIYNGDELVYTATTKEGKTWTVPADFEPVVPNVLPLKLYGTGFENWSGNTQLLVQPIVMPESLIGDHDTEWTITFAWDGGSKTVTQKATSEYRWSSTATKTIVRFTPVIADKDNQFIPEVGVAYTVSGSVTVDGVTYTFESEAGEYSFTAAEGAIVPDEYKYEDETPVTPDTPDAPETGDATVFAIVFAAVAMLGMAVVVTKKVNA